LLVRPALAFEILNLVDIIDDNGLEKDPAFWKEKFIIFNEVIGTKSLSTGFCCAINYSLESERRLSLLLVLC